MVNSCTLRPGTDTTLPDGAINAPRPGWPSGLLVSTSGSKAGPYGARGSVNSMFSAPACRIRNS